jgi:tripartite-type tricarboxylate transporter receptor subunit TctC
MFNSILKSLLVGGALLGAQSCLADTAYPSKPINLVVPYVAGASTDTLARLVGKSVGEQLKQAVIVENRAGAGGIIAADYTRREKPDGYTFMLTTDGILSVNPAIYKSVPYDSAKDFTPLSIAVAAPLVLVVRTESQFKTLQDVIDYARKHPRDLTYGSAGIGTSQHIAGELLNDLAGIQTTHVPYKGGAPAMTDLLGGHVSMMFVQTASAADLAKAGKIRILGIGSPQRSPMLPDVPTFEQLGVKGYDSDTWYGFNMPPGADPKVVALLHDAIVNGLRQNRQYLESVGYTVVAGSPADMAANIKQNSRKWEDLAKKANLYHQQ